MITHTHTNVTNIMSFKNKKQKKNWTWKKARVSSWRWMSLAVLTTWSTQWSFSVSPVVTNYGIPNPQQNRGKKLLKEQFAYIWGRNESAIFAMDIHATHLHNKHQWHSSTPKHYQQQPTHHIFAYCVIGKSFFTNW